MPSARCFSERRFRLPLLCDFFRQSAPPQGSCFASHPRKRLSVLPRPGGGLLSSCGCGAHLGGGAAPPPLPGRGRRCAAPAGVPGERPFPGEREGAGASSGPAPAVAATASRPDTPGAGWGAAPAAGLDGQRREAARSSRGHLGALRAGPRCPSSRRFLGGCVGASARDGVAASRFWRWLPAGGFASVPGLF